MSVWEVNEGDEGWTTALNLHSLVNRQVRGWGKALEEVEKFIHNLWRYLFTVTLSYVKKDRQRTHFSSTSSGSPLYASPALETLVAQKNLRLKRAGPESGQNLTAFDASGGHGKQVSLAYLRCTSTAEGMMSKYETILYWSEADQAVIAEAPELAGCSRMERRTRKRSRTFK